MNMLFPLIKGLAVVLGALGCGFFLFEFMETRARKEYRESIRRRLRTAPDEDSVQVGTRDTRAGAQGNRMGAHGSQLGVHSSQAGVHGNQAPALRTILRRIPFLGRRLEGKEQLRARANYYAELPKMFEVIALGMRVGLAFDQAFALYVRGFQTNLADVCRERFDVWERGLISREAGLRELAAHINLKEFDRFVSLVLRALEYGAPLTHLLNDLASDARKAYRTQRQEKVAKAPVKMLIPTGMLILPAMMMLVLGPMVLDITERLV